MVRRVPAMPADRNQRDQSRQDRLAALSVRLQETARCIRTPEDWARCLQTAARLPAETWANILLISSARPDATLVRGYEAWRAVGRHVGRDEKGIAIFAITPQRKGARHTVSDEQEGHSWREADHVTYVWDVSQTSGQPRLIRNAIPLPRAEAPSGLWDALCWLARREGYAVEHELGCPDEGSTLWTARRIRVRPGLTSSQAIWALAHQLGHVLLRSPVVPMPGTTTTGCHGVQKAEADSVAFITCVRHGVSFEHTFPSPLTWAGTDPRTRPGAIILAVGQRITNAASRISQQLADRTIGLPAPTEAETTRLTAVSIAPASLPKPDPRIDNVLLDAEQFYIGQLATSWVPAYLRKRGLTAAAIGEWHIGYAPRGWTALTSYLRDRGHRDDVIQAAGLARVGSRGTLIDHFRDRVMLPVRAEQGNPAGFIGRARSGAGPAIPKYLNGPATSTYQKGDLLFGLYQARDHLAHDATPVIVEGPFDAIAVTLANPDHYAGLAPCGTALTSSQAAALGRAVDLRQTRILVAFDDDGAGRKAAVRAYAILRPLSDRLQSVTLLGKDPAEILETEGPESLHTILQDRVQPLSAVVIDEYLVPWEARLRDAEGPLLAMRSTATLIADLLPPETARAIFQITRNKELPAFDDHMRPVVNPELTKIARALPADTIYQIIRTAERLSFADYSDVLAEVANAVTRQGAHPKGRPHSAASHLAGNSFPYLPLTTNFSIELVTTPRGRSGSRTPPPRTKRRPAS